MSDDHTVVALFVEQLVDALGELEPNLIVHVLRTDVDELLTTDVGQIKHLGNGVDQCLNANLSCAVGRRSSRLAHTCDGAAGSNDTDFRFSNDVDRN